VSGDFVRPGNGFGRAYARIEVPPDIEALDIGSAQAWRQSTRSAFVRLLAYGYRVIGFYTEERERCFYVLLHPGEGAAG
jgi:predicted GNAT superfamily acetyltransferase